MNIKLPNDWNLLRIKDLNCQDGEVVQTGPFGSQLHSSDYVKKGVPFILIRNFKNDIVDTSDIPFITIEDAQRLEKYRLKEGDIIFSRVGRIGDTVYTEEFMDSWLISGQLLRIRSNDERILNRFLNYVLKSDYVQKQINANYVGSTRKSLNSAILENLKFPLPSINEQKKIIFILSNIKQLIDKTLKIIENLNILKKGLMQRLFTEGIGHTEFKETTLGKIPKEWEIVPISKIGKVIGGGTPDTKFEKYWNGHILWATPTDITNLQEKYISQTNRNISNEGLNNSSAKIIPPFSLLMTSRASIGYCAINTKEICTNQGFQNIVPNEKINVEFLYHMIQSHKIQNQLIRFAYGSTFLEIPNKDVKKIKLPLPKLDEQQKIASILSNLDSIILNNNQKILYLKLVKKGLMQDLLTGKKRVKIN